MPSKRGPTAYAKEKRYVYRCLTTLLREAVNGNADWMCEDESDTSKYVNSFALRRRIKAA